MKSKGVYVLWSVNYLYMVAYSILLNTLSLYFTQQHLSPYHSYAIGVTHIALSGIIATLSGYCIPRFATHRYAIITGLGICTVALLFLSFGDITLHYWAMAVFTLGVAISVPNGLVLLNRECQDPHEKQKVQNINYLLLNLAAITGFLLYGIGGRYHYNDFNVFHAIAAGFMLMASLVFYFGMRHLQPPKTEDLCKTSKPWPFVFLLIILMFCAFLVIRFAITSQYIIITVGVLISLGILFYSRHKMRRGGLAFLFIMLFVGFTFWADSAFFHVVLIVFIKERVALDIPPTTLMMINPVAIIILSAFLAILYRHVRINHFKKLYIGALLICLGYLILCFGMWKSSLHAIAAIWVVANLILSSCAECLIEPTVTVFANQYTPRRYDSVFMGLMRVYRGFFFCLSILFLSTLTNIHQESGVIPHISNGFLAMILLSFGTLIITVLIRWQRHKRN